MRYCVIFILVCTGVSFDYCCLFCLTVQPILKILPQCLSVGTVGRDFALC